MYNLQARRVISSTLQRFHCEALFVSKSDTRYQIEGAPMRTAVKLVTMMNNLLVPMSARIPATQPANLIAYWKLGETSGSTADDSSATGADGVYSGTYTLGQTGIGDGSLSTPLSRGRGGWIARNRGIMKRLCIAWRRWQTRRLLQSIMAHHQEALG